MAPEEAAMRVLGLLFLCGALTLTGCDAGGSGYATGDQGTGTALEAIGIGAAIYDAEDQAQHRYHFKPGLNVKAPDNAGQNQPFEVMVADANANAKPQKDWWGADRTPRITIATPDGVEGATLVKTEVKREWHIAKY
jgi:hypothetical protein